MLVSSLTLLESARKGGYAVGGFDVYNLEGIRAILAAADAERSPIIMQIPPAAMRFGGMPFIAFCQASARNATVPVAVHLDHASSPDDIRHALAVGVNSIMIDGSRMPFERNVMLTRNLASLAHEHHAVVEATLGSLLGREEAQTHAANLTDPEAAATFVQQTGVDVLAVYIGKEHGDYRDEPQLDLVRLAQIRQVVDVPLVLHGVSGFPDRLVRIAIELGVSKLNVSTEVRTAYLRALRTQLDGGASTEMIPLMEHVSDAMRGVIVTKIQLFGSAGRADDWDYSPLT